MKTIAPICISILSFIFAATMLVCGITEKISLGIGIAAFIVFALVSIRIPVRILTEEEDG